MSEWLIEMFIRLIAISSSGILFAIGYDCVKHAYRTLDDWRYSYSYNFIMLMVSMFCFGFGCLLLVGGLS